MEEQNLKTKFNECYEEILIGFILELKKTNNSGRNIGRKLANLIEFMEIWNA